MQVKRQHRTKQPEMLDAICARVYDNRPDALQLVLDANPGLARLGPIIPKGTLIHLPELPQVKKSVITLWG